MTSPLEELRLKRVIVVGAGQAGLAMGHALARIGLRPQVDFMILDAAVAGERAWNRRWHSLRLFTPARHSSLPGIAFPGDGSRYPRTDEVSVYLDDYANQLGLVPMWGTRVHGVQRDPHGHGMILMTKVGEVTARNVVAVTRADLRTAAPSARSERLAVCSSVKLRGSHVRMHGSSCLVFMEFRRIAKEKRAGRGRDLGAMPIRSRSTEVQDRSASGRWNDVPDLVLRP